MYNFDLDTDKNFDNEVFHSIESTTLKKVDKLSNKLDTISEAEIKSKLAKQNEVKGQEVKILGLNPILAVTISITLIVGLSVAILFVKNKSN